MFHPPTNNTETQRTRAATPHQVCKNKIYPVRLFRTCPLYSLQIPSHNLDVGMIRRQELCQDVERALKARARTRQVPKVVQDAAEVVDADGDVGMVGTQRGFANFECALKARARVGKFRAAAQVHPQLIQQARGRLGRNPQPFRLVRHRARAPPGARSSPTTLDSS